MISLSLGWHLFGLLGEDLSHTAEHVGSRWMHHCRRSSLYRSQWVMQLVWIQP